MPVYLEGTPLKRAGRRGRVGRVQSVLSGCLRLSVLVSPVTPTRQSPGAIPLHRPRWTSSQPVSSGQDRAYVVLTDRNSDGTATENPRIRPRPGGSGSPGGPAADPRHLARLHLDGPTPGESRHRPPGADHPAAHTDLRPVTGNPVRPADLTTISTAFQSQDVGLHALRRTRSWDSRSPPATPTTSNHQPLVDHCQRLMPVTVVE